MQFSTISFLQVPRTIIYGQKITSFFKGSLWFFFIPPSDSYNDKVLLIVLAQTLLNLIKLPSLPSNPPATVDTHGGI